MTTRPYAAARRTLSITDKLFEVNWGLILLIGIIASAGFAMLYSVAGGTFFPWAAPQMLRFAVGLVILVSVALIDNRVWMSLAYPAYAVSLLLLIVVVIAGHVGKGAERWITLGPLGLQPSELMKISLILALARYLHGLSVEDVSKPLKLAIPLIMIAMPVALRGAPAQPQRTTLIILGADGLRRCCFSRACPGGGLRWSLAGAAVAIPTAVAVCAARLPEAPRDDFPRS